MYSFLGFIYWQSAASYAQTRILDIVQFVVSQTSVKPRPAQAEHAPPRATSVTIDAPLEEPLSLSSSTSSSHHSEDVTEESEVTSPAPSAQLPLKSSTWLFPASAVPVSPPVAETSAAASLKAKPDPMEIDHTTAAATEQSNSPKVTVMDKTLKSTIARLRKNRTTTGTAK